MSSGRLYETKDLMDMIMGSGPNQRRGSEDPYSMSKASSPYNQSFSHGSSMFNEN